MRSLRIRLHIVASVGQPYAASSVSRPFNPSWSNNPSWSKWLVPCCPRSEAKSFLRRSVRVRFSPVHGSKEDALVLARIHDVIHAHLKKSDNSDMVADITAALSLEKVRQQLNQLISESLETFNKARWNEIIPVLAEIISRNKLKIGRTSRLSKILQRIKSKPLKGTSVVDELSIIKVRSDCFGASKKKR